MGETNFPNGITVRGVKVVGGSGGGSVDDAITGNVFFVDSGSGSDGTSNSGSSAQPFATVDYAVDRCTANNGDVIYVMPGHTETLAADSAVNIDVAGVSVIGLGKGEDRPVFTFTTDTDADFKIAANNVTVKDLVFKCNIASQAMMIEVSGDDAAIINCEFREGSATGLNFVTVGVADGDSDRCRIEGCTFHMPTAGNGDSAISLAKDHTGVRILNNLVYGDFDLAGIDIPAAGNAQVDCIIAGNVVTNLLTGQHAIQINGTGSTGKLINNYVESDTYAASIDAGGLEAYGNLWSDGTDQESAIDPLPAVDHAGNLIGADNSNNAAATTNVAANEDGSVLERLEHVQEAVNKGTGTALAANESLVDVLYGANGIGTYPAAAAAANNVSIAEVLRYVSEKQEWRLVSKAYADLTGYDTAAAFTVTGDVMVQVVGVVGATGITSTSGTTVLSLGTTEAAEGIIANSTIDNTQFAATDVWVDSSPANDVEAMAAQDTHIIGGGANIILTRSVDDITAGALTLYCWYKPLSSDGAVVAA